MYALRWTVYLVRQLIWAVVRIFSSRLWLLVGLFVVFGV